MNRDNIRKMIQMNKLTCSSPGLFGVMVRKFEELQQLDEQLKGDSFTEEDLLQLQNENAQLEKDILTVNEEIVQTERNACTARVEVKDSLDTLKRESLAEIKAHIKKLEGECDSIRQEMNAMPDKPAEMKRLKGKLEELQTENYKLQFELDKLGKDDQAQIKLHQRLKVFVEKLEALEERMSNIMSDIWNGLKKDSFDRMCNL